MRQDTFGDDSDDRLVFLMGWGNRAHHPDIQWLVGHLTDAGYRVDTFELPRAIEDFDAEYLDPVQSYLAGLDSYRLLGHSTGGLIARFVDDLALRTRTYLSPWWGLNERMDNRVVRSLARLPTARSVLPVRVSREQLGALASDEWLADTPRAAAPSFLATVQAAQQRLPPFDDDDVVFYSPTDAVVGVDAIVEQTPEANRVAYQGGHELFCSRSREDHLDTLLAAIDRGVDALED